MLGQRGHAVYDCKVIVWVSDSSNNNVDIF